MTEAYLKIFKRQAASFFFKKNKEKNFFFLENVIQFR